MVYVPAIEMPEDVTEQCDSVEYQFTGGVQPHACLFVLSLDGEILQVSSNVAEQVGRDVDTVLGETLNRLFPEVSWQNLPAGGSLSESGPAVLGPQFQGRGGLRMSSRITRNGERIFIELEPLTLPVDIEGHLRGILSAFSSSLAKTRSVSEAAEVAARLLRNELGYDRCMVYRFDEDLNGEVIGETRAHQQLESYLGMRFPASDIPRSAREMFRSSPVRLTVDPLADPALLVPLLDPISGQHTDLSGVRSRITAGPCRTFYANMGVRATLVLPVMIFDRLWGQISFHHLSPRRVHAKHDELLAHLAHDFGQNLIRLQFEERLEGERIAMQVQEQFAASELARPSAESMLRPALDQLAQLLGSQAVFLSIANKTVLSGETVEPELAKRLKDAMSQNQQVPAIWSNRLAEDYPDLAEDLGPFAGALLVRIGHAWDDFLLCLRYERPLETVWAGDPRENLTWEHNGRPSLQPRSSFAEFKAITKQTSAPWTEQDQMIAESCSLPLSLKYLKEKAEIGAVAQAQFLANISHELRTPMTAIMGYAELLSSSASQELDPDESRMWAVSIFENSEHLLTLINDVLDVCKVESGKLSLEKMSVDVGQVVRQVTELLGRTADHKGIRLDVQRDTRVPQTIISDPTRLRQILLNLVSNAIKFTSAPGRVTLEITVDDEQGQIRFRVSDTGIGMTAEQLERIRRFEKFQQADASTTRRFGGTGLGLFISQQLARLMEGSLVVDSVPGEGATFTLTLPLRKAKRHVPGVKVSEAAQPNSGLAVSSRPHPQPLADMSILLAEDGPDNQLLITHILKKAGASVEVVGDGREAVEQIRESDRSFDLVLMDLQMPIMGGREAARALRAAGRSMPIIALTAHAMAGEREKCLAEGFTDYESKPIKKDRLVELVARFRRTSTQTS